MYLDITGIILSGGKSKRMEANKSLLDLNGITVIERITGLMKTLFSHVILIANEPDLYEFLKIPIYSDIYPYRGPLSGIHSGLVHSQTEKNFIISCDIPLINAEIISSLVEYQSDKEIIVATDDGYIQQLCGVYFKSNIIAAEKLLMESIEEENRNKEQKKRKCSVRKLIESQNSEIISDSSILHGYFPGIFSNMNTPEDYEFVKSKLNIKK